MTSLILLMPTMLPSLCLISSKQTVSSNQCLCCYTGLKVIVAQDKTPKRGCRYMDQPSTILIDGACASWRSRGVHLYLVSKQCSNGYTADRMFYAGLDLPVQWWILYREYRISGRQNPTQRLQDGEGWATGRHQLLITLLLVCEKWTRTTTRRSFGGCARLYLEFGVTYWCYVGVPCPGCRPCWSLGSCTG